MKILFLIFVIKITQCEYDKRIITTLKYSKYHAVPTVVNGYPAVRGQIPYVVSIKEAVTQRNYSVLWRSICGGSIISTMQVLTAAHCFESHAFHYEKYPDLLRLVAGTLQSDILHTGVTETTDQAQWRKIHKVYLHKNFVFPQNDIALAIVDVPWNFTEHVNYAAVATMNLDYHTSCFSVGFGDTSHDISPILLRAKIDVMPLWKCTAIWEMDMSPFICTNSAFSDVGFGDSGGPLACRLTLDPAEEPGRDVLVGVVSGKNFDKTSLFTRVSQFRNWIDHPNGCGSKFLSGTIFCVVVCEHCQAPVDRQHHTVLEGYSYHEKCRKCYVCSETNLHGAEVFKGVIFCSSCSQRIFQGCSTARRTKESARRTRDKSRRRRSHRTKEKIEHTGHPTGILEMTGLIASSDTSKSCSDATKASQKSKSIVVSAEMALTVPKPTYHEVQSIKRNSAEVGVTTEVTQQLLEELNCPVVKRYHHKNSSPLTSPPRLPLKKKSPCSDLRIAELGTSREIANMALRHKYELPVIIKSESHPKPMTSTSESILNRESDSGDHHEEWMDSAYSTLDDSLESQGKDMRLRSILKSPYLAFKRNILNRSSLISDIMSVKDSVCVIRKIKTAFHHECTGHQRRGLKRLYSTINRKKVPNKLGWLNLVTNVYCNHSESALKLSNGSYQKRCKHFHTSHSYRCMRAQAMKLAGPTKSELAVIRRKIKNLIAPRFVRNLAIAYSKRPAILMSHACGSSKAVSCFNGKTI